MYLIYTINIQYTTQYDILAWEGVDRIILIRLI